MERARFLVDWAVTRKQRGIRKAIPADGERDRTDTQLGRAFVCDPQTQTRSQVSSIVFAVWPGAPWSIGDRLPKHPITEHGSMNVLGLKSFNRAILKIASISTYLERHRFLPKMSRELECMVPKSLRWALSVMPPFLNLLVSGFCWLYLEVPG